MPVFPLFHSIEFLHTALIYLLLKEEHESWEDVQGEKVPEVIRDREEEGEKKEEEDWMLKVSTCTSLWNSRAQLC